MLIISRKIDEKIKIGDDIEIVIVDINKGQVKIGINAPKNIPIFREELIENIKNENKKANKEIEIEKINALTKVINEN